MLNIDNRIIFISQTKGFMMNSIVKSLEEMGFDMKIVNMDPLAIEEGTDVTDKVYLLNIDSPEGTRESLEIIKERVQQYDLSVVLICQKEALPDICQVMPENYFAKVVIRPVNVKDLGIMMFGIQDEKVGAFEKKKILVVDDDGVMLRTIKNWLSDKYQIVMVNSGMAAIQYLTNNTADLILLDYEMPITNGTQILEMIRSDAAMSHIPVMFLTNKSDRETVMKILSLHPEKYILKTSTKEEVHQIVDTFFKNQK